MLSRLTVTALVACGAAWPCQAADLLRPVASVTRDDYDAYVAAVLMERKVASCQAHSPAIHDRFALRIARWRDTNVATIARLDAPAHRWQLPGGRSLDSLLAAMAESTEEEIAAGTQGAIDARCEHVFGIVTASGDWSERP